MDGNLSLTDFEVSKASVLSETAEKMIVKLRAGRRERGRGIFWPPGFESAPKPQARAFWHGGSGEGGYSVMISYPDKGIAVALMTNVSASGYLIFPAHELAMHFAQ